MKQSPPSCLRGSSRGMSLIEMMISIVIGLVITIAIVSAYLGSAGATRLSEAQVRMNEDGQAALTILAQQIRMAGNNPKQVNYTAAVPRNPIYDSTSTFIVRGCDGTFTNINTAANMGALTCAGGGSPDSVAISYEADRYNTIPTTNSSTDCLGNGLATRSASVDVWNGAASVPVNVTFTVADNRFYIGTSTVITSPSLYCKGNGSPNQQPLVENIEDLQLRYGTAPVTATSTLSVAGYLNADQVSALGLPGGDPENWSKVLTVRICVVVRSERPLLPDAESARYLKCDGTLSSAQSDLLLRRAYVSSVVLRNRAPAP